MHTTKFDSFIVHHHGDYGGEIEFIQRVNGESVFLDIDKEEPVSLYLEMSEVMPLIKNYSRSLESEKIKVTRRIKQESPSGATRSFEVDGKDLFDLYVGSIQHGLIGKLEQMESSEFYTRFMKSLDVSAEDICKGKAEQGTHKAPARIRIWGKVDVVQCSGLTALKESDGLWMFVDYAERGIKLGTTFGGGTCQLTKIIDQYGRVFKKEIPQGYKAICKFKFSNDIPPASINELPTLIDWRLTQNAVYLHADD